MPNNAKTTHGGYRFYGVQDAAGRKLSPLLVSGHIIVKADMGSATKQLVGKLARGMKPINVFVLAPTGVTVAAAGTFRVDLEAVTTPSLAAVNLVAAATVVAPGSKAIAAGFGAAYLADRDISITPATGTTGQTLTLAIECIPDITLVANS